MIKSYDMDEDDENDFVADPEDLHGGRFTKIEEQGLLTVRSII